MALETHSNDIAPTLRTLTNWTLICEPMKEEKNKEQELKPTIIANTAGFGTCYESVGVSPTIKASAFAYNNVVKEPTIAAMIGRADGEWHLSEHNQKLEERKDGVTNTITGVSKDNMVVEQNNLPFRVRRLTERECFRLMDLNDDDIDKIQAAGIPRTQQYKMAGNSICVGVLEAIFDKMFIHTEPESEQLELF